MNLGNLTSDIFAAKPWQLMFQDPATPIMEGIIDLHNDVMFYIIVIVTLVLWILLRIIYLFSPKRFGYYGPVSTNTHNTTVEVIWTITPALILLVIALPSFALLYAMDEVIDPALTLKVIGHQWYWSYEYSDYNQTDRDSIAFDSYLVPTDELAEGSLRLLEVDNRVVLPALTHIRVIITGADVIHNWAIPALGIKVDAVPGRLSQTSIFMKRNGTFYGQCSEICGVNHGYMPIVIESIHTNNYVAWVQKQMEHPSE